MKEVFSMTYEGHKVSIVVSDGDEEPIDTGLPFVVMVDDEPHVPMIQTIGRLVSYAITSSVVNGINSVSSDDIGGEIREAMKESLGEYSGMIEQQMAMLLDGMVCVE